MVVGILVALALVGTGCGQTGGRSVTLPPITTTTTTQPPLPVTPIVWAPCRGNLQCGTLTVPLDYAHPHRATIGIALSRHLAGDPAHRIGSLVINPGGPGVSGIDDFANELSVLTPQLQADFDIVTFDPRGVERSDPVSCQATAPSAQAAPQAAAPDPVPQTTAAQKATIAGLRRYGAACKKASGAILPFVGTVDVARDMDRLRNALGDAGLTFIGQSYGSLIGEVYAQLFPTRVRAMVLDSVIDPALSLTQMVADQSKGFEGALMSFFAWCAGHPACPWRPAGDPTAALLAQLASSATAPVPAGGGRHAGAGELYDALLDGLYSPSAWSRLGSALAADAGGNGALVLAMSGTYTADGSTNGSDAAEAIDCLDHPTSRKLSAYDRQARIMALAAPVFGPLLAWGQASCAVWPILPTRTPSPVRAAGSPPILVIGTTNDPATPYAWAANVAHELRAGVLLTRNGIDHVAYFYSSCVRTSVQAYLLTGATPPPGTTCTS
jgi:pimeloyl-ACP methyl ester carboxylesterase